MRIIEQWAVVDRRTSSSFRDPEHPIICISGLIYNHEQREEFQSCTNGRVWFSPTVIGFEDERVILADFNEKYLLGEILPEFDRSFPQALQRLRKRFKID